MTPDRRCAVESGGGRLQELPRRPGRDVTPSAAARLDRPEAFLSRSDLRDLGLERRAVDAIFRALPVVSLPGYSRPLVKVVDYLELVERSTYVCDRVRPC